MTRLYVLYEHAAGYGIFKVEEFEEIGMFLPQLEGAINDLARFNSIVKLIGFLPFKTKQAAVDNMNAVVNGMLTDTLKDFVDTTVPKGSKRSKITLGVEDPKLALTISNGLGIQCTYCDAVPEVIRGIKRFFHNLVQGFTETSALAVQLGLSHSFSRDKVQFNVRRVDNMVIQSIAILDQLDKDINTFTMRIREWYSYSFPELIKIVPDNYTYARLVKLIKNCEDISEESLDAIEEITMDSGKAQAIVAAARSSVGMKVSDVDLINIEKFAERVIGLSEHRKEVSEYLKIRMNDIAPNLGTLIGDQIGARLISRAGSLANLAKSPASTIQILGAEKALFRALKTRGNTPKYGLLYNSSFIGRAGSKNKGRVSRYVANKCCIAARLDCFSDNPTNVFGEKLKQQVEDRLKFYDTGEIPKNNFHVMKEAMVEQAEIIAEELEDKKKGKKRKSEVQTENGIVLEESPKKKKKINKFNDTLEEVTQEETIEQMEVETPEKNKKDNKKNKFKEEVTHEETVEPIEAETPGRKKKKNKKNKSNESLVQEVTQEESIEQMEVETPEKNKKQNKKNKSRESLIEEVTHEETVETIEAETRGKKKKKNKKNKSNESLIEEVTQEETVEQIS